MKLRVKVRWDGAAYSVDLPEYRMVPGSWEPLIPAVIHADGVYPAITTDDPRLNALSCEVEVPDRIVDPNTGRPDMAKIRGRYRNDPKWNTERVLDTEV